MNLLRRHIVYVLWIVLSADLRPGTIKLIGLVDHIPQTAPAGACVFSIGDVYPVHDDRGYGTHTVLALSARLALQNPGQQFSVIKRHINHPFYSMQIRQDA